MVVPDASGRATSIGAYAVAVTVPWGTCGKYGVCPSAVSIASPITSRYTLSGVTPDASVARAGSCQSQRHQPRSVYDPICISWTALLLSPRGWDSRHPRVAKLKVTVDGRS